MSIITQRVIVAQEKTESRRTCWTMTPLPDIVYWRDLHTFTICCDTPTRDVTEGAWYFVNAAAEVISQGRFSSDSNPCVSFSVIVPVRATQFLITAGCTPRGDPEARECGRNIDIPCTDRPVPIINT